jgi:hypothetical protein
MSVENKQYDIASNSIFTRGAPSDAFYCNLLLHIEGIALQGSFLLPFKSD